MTTLTSDNYAREARNPAVIDLSPLVALHSECAAMRYRIVTGEGVPTNAYKTLIARCDEATAPIIAQFIALIKDRVDYEPNNHRYDLAALLGVVDGSVLLTATWDDHTGGAA